MAQNVSEVDGVSTESFAKAAETAVQTAAKTVRNLKWFRVTEFEGRIDKQKIMEYHATVKIYFDIES